MEFPEIRNEKITADGVAGADADLSPGGGGLHELGLPALDQVHGRLHVAQQDLPLRRQLDPLCAPDEEHLVQLSLQRLDGWLTAD